MHNLQSVLSNFHPLSSERSILDTQISQHPVQVFRIAPGNPTLENPELSPFRHFSPHWISYIADAVCLKAWTIGILALYIIINSFIDAAADLDSPPLSSRRFRLINRRRHLKYV